MKVVFFETTEEDEQILRGLMPSIDASFHKERLWQGNASLAKDAEVISVFINSEVRKDVIDALPNLKLVTTRSGNRRNSDVF